jgi:hypothetical protein
MYLQNGHDFEYKALFNHSTKIRSRYNILVRKIKTVLQKIYSHKTLLTSWNNVLKKLSSMSGRVFSFKMQIPILMPKIQTEHDPALVSSTPILFIFLNIDLLLGRPSGCFP